MRRPGAAACFRRALALAPGLAEARRNLAGMLAAAGRRAGAEACLRIGSADPAVARALADLLHADGRGTEAIPLYRRAAAARPRDLRVLRPLAEALQAAGHNAEAAAVCRRVIAVEPGAADGHAFLGTVLFGVRRYRAAGVAFATARAAAPHGDIGIAAACREAHLRRALCDWSGEAERLAALARRLAAALDRAEDVAIPVWLLEALPLPIALQARAARHHAARVARRAAAMPPPVRRPRPAGDRLRLGYVSPDFREHAVGRLVRDLFARHDRGRVEVLAYSLIETGDPVQQAIRAGVDRFADLSGTPAAAAAQRIADDGVDILVDLAGYTTHSRPEIFALRPAPVQCHWLGHLGTLGADCTPWMIADAIAVDDRLAATYSESVLRLPGCFAVASPTDVPPAPSRAEVGLPATGVVFACFNEPYKIDPAVFDAWMRILDATAGAVLWLLDGGSARVRQNLRREAAARRVAPDRLVFAGRVDHDAHLARLRCAELFLDTFAYNAGGTAAGALWAGLPVLTRIGDTFLRRMGASLCTAAGLADLVCASDEAYVATAVALAADPPALAALRVRLERDRSRLPLFDVCGFARRLERALEALWEHHRGA